LKAVSGPSEIFLPFFLLFVGLFEVRRSVGFIIIIISAALMLLMMFETTLRNG
jgi:hypothetical protein